MQRGVVAILSLGIAAASLFAQVRVITRPKIPSQQVLEQLGLAFNWHARISLEGPLDSIYSVEIIPRATGKLIRTELLVQTAAGAVHLFDGETGKLLWFTTLGAPYRHLVPAAYNSKSIFAVRNRTFYILNRSNGEQQVYKRMQGEREYGVELESLPTAGPAANDTLIAFPFPNKLSTYLLPDFEHPTTRGNDTQDNVGSPQPMPHWNYYDPAIRIISSPAIFEVATKQKLPPNVVQVDPTKLLPPPIMISPQIIVQTIDRQVISLGPSLGQPLGQGQVINRTTMAHDSYVYSLDPENGKVVWRFAAGSPIVRRPLVNDRDVFVVSQNRGMFRLNRLRATLQTEVRQNKQLPKDAPTDDSNTDTGDSALHNRDYWLQPEAVQFLAAHYYKDSQDKFKIDSSGRVSAKFVYATDSKGQLLILDGVRGGILAQLDTRDWQTPVENEWTDRLYLGNPDGQLLCLRPLGNRWPQANKSFGPVAEPDPPEPVSPTHRPSIVVANPSLPTPVPPRHGTGARP